VSTTLVLISVGLVLQVTQSKALRRILIDEGLKRHEAEARLIERTFREATDARAARREVGAILAQVQSRPDVANAYVIDSTGTVIVAGDPNDEGEMRYTPAIEAVLRSADPVSKAREAEITLSSTSPRSSCPPEGWFSRWRSCRSCSSRSSRRCAARRWERWDRAC
jgi:hypothetical protein